MKKGKTVIQKPLEARKASPLLVSLSAVFLGIVAGCFFILCIGKNPFAGFEKILFGALSNTRRIGNTIGMSTQLILIGLSVAFAVCVQDRSFQYRSIRTDAHWRNHRVASCFLYPDERSSTALSSDNHNSGDDSWCFLGFYLWLSEGEVQCS